MNLALCGRGSLELIECISRGLLPSCLGGGGCGFVWSSF